MADNNDVVLKDDDIVLDYSKLSGYNGDTGANNRGVPLLDALNYWRKNGVVGHKIYAYAEIDPADIELVKTAIYLFGGIYLAFDLPATAKTQDIWRVINKNLKGDSAPGTWGLHCVSAIGYDKDYIYIVTWGIRKRATWEFWKAYCTEAYAVISNEFIVNGKAPNGFDLDSLKKKLKALSKVDGDNSDNVDNADTGDGCKKSIWDKYGDKLPSIFQKTIYRDPTNEELAEVARVRFTAPELLQGFNYTTVGRGINNPVAHKQMKTALTKLSKRYPLRTEYAEALKEVIQHPPIQVVTVAK